MKSKFGEGIHFNTTLFLIAIVLTSFSVSFLWKFFDMDKRAINLPLIRVFVDYALRFNTDAKSAKENMLALYDKCKNIDYEKVSIENKMYLYILFAVKTKDDFNKFFPLLYRNTQIHFEHDSYNRGKTIGITYTPIEVLDVDYFTEVEVSKINAGKKSQYEEKVLKYVKSSPLDENGKIIFKSRIKEALMHLENFRIIKKYTIKNDIAEYTLNEAVIRWHHRDYLGNSYTKLEENLSTLLEAKPQAVFISLFILLTLPFFTKWALLLLTLIILPFYLQKAGDFISKHISNYISKYLPPKPSQHPSQKP